jgi:hypothetical protein
MDANYPGGSEPKPHQTKPSSTEHEASGDTITGLPASLAKDALALLYAGGECIAIGLATHLELFHLAASHSGRHARSIGVYRLPGSILGLAESALGLLIAAQCEEGTRILLIRDGHPIPLLELKGRVTALAAAGGFAYAVLKTAECGGRLVSIDLRQRAVSASAPLDHGNMQLAVDPSGEPVVLTDRTASRVMSLQSNLKPAPAPAPQPGPSADQPHRSGCRCYACCPDQTTKPEPGPNDPPTGSRPSGGDTPQRPDAPGGTNGQTGVPSGNGGTVVGNGGHVSHHPKPGQDWDPCGRHMFYTVDTLHRMGAYFLAASVGGRQAALLSADMNLLQEWQFGRGGARILSAADTPAMVMHLHGSGKWIFQDAFHIAGRHGDLGVFPVRPLDSKVFIGQPTMHTMSHGQKPVPTNFKVLILPVMEGAQTFSSPNLAGFGAFIDRTAGPLLRDFYIENSFGALKDLSVKVFGGGVGPDGGPLKLPRNLVLDYYFPTYTPARVELVKNGATATTEIVLDGRESLSIQATPLTGGMAGATVTLPFYALGFQRDEAFYPVQVKFLGTEKLTLSVVTPAGTAATLQLNFTAKTFDIAKDTDVATVLPHIISYLDGIMAAAESAAGIAPRLFAAPDVRQIRRQNSDFGRLWTSFRAATLTGTKMRITSAFATLAGGSDPIGLNEHRLGTISGNNDSALAEYLENPALLAQDATTQFGYTNRLLNDPSAEFKGSTMMATIAIENRHGGPGAEVKMTASSGLQSLFDIASPQPNSATTKNNSQALRDRSQIYEDAYSAAVDRLLAAGRSLDELNGFDCYLVLPIEPGTPAAGNPEAPLASELWNITALNRPFEFRGAENITTVGYAKDKKTQVSTRAWALIFMPAGIPDNPMIWHEVGHALGFGDLYHQEGYRNELAYMDDWAMMSEHRVRSHHCGYHKLQAGWIPEGAGREDDYGRTFPIGVPDADRTITKEVLLVPVELWRDSLAGSARAAFGVDASFPVAQLISIDFGGDGMTFGLIEARQPGANYSQSLPGGGGVLLSNGISWIIDERFATNTWYRRSLQLLNPNNILSNAGDTFDMALAPELPLKGTSVRLVGHKLVEGDTTVYRVEITRKNAEFVDLYFTLPEVYYKNPDLWIDWPGNNGTNNPPGSLDHYPLGSPGDQGDAIRVHPTDAEIHKVVARLRNRGQVDALDVKLNFFYFEPPGSGDGRKPMDVTKLDKYKLIGTVPAFPKVPGGDTETIIPLDWNVPGGFSGHTCILVQIEDYRIPRDSHGAALGSDDVWQVNNHAQKNVDKFESLKVNPFTPVEFDFSVFNAGVSPETAYLEPEGLPYGMTLTVTPPIQTIPEGTAVLFHCKVELDSAIIKSGCENDQRFRIHAWRQDPESSARWGGVEYEIRPRETTATQISGYWDQSNNLALKGSVTPNPGGGTVYIRLGFGNHQASWVSVSLAANGTFSWSGKAPSDSFSLDTLARFEGNRKFGSSKSNPLRITPPPVIR